MANFVFNRAKGRVGEFYHRVENNDPSTSGFVIVPLETSGLEADSTLKDHDTLSALLAGSSNEQTTMGRKTLTDTDLAAVPNPDDTNDRYDFDIPDQTWSAATGNAISKLVICFAPDTSGADSTLIPMTAHDFVVTPDGSDIVAQVNAAGFFRAQEPA